MTSGTTALRIAAALLLLGAPLLAAERAGAELLRCKGPDGRTIYTDDPAICPDAKPFEPTGEVQTVPSERTARPASRAPRARPSRAGPDPSEAEAARWQAKRRDAEASLQALTTREEELGRYVTWCNRGRRLYQTDESGLRSRVSCDEVRAEYESIEQRRSELRAYLDGGLQDECRRSGCLPGWIR